MNVLFVCYGNICRSPTAEGVFARFVERAGLASRVRAQSAGTSGYHEGELPDSRSVACMKKHGIDITYQHSRPISTDDLQRFDLIYVMDSSNYRDVTNLARNEEELHKIKLIMSEVYADKVPDVPDPYYGGDHGFENVYKMLDKATDRIIERYSGKTA